MTMQSPQLCPRLFTESPALRSRVHLVPPKIEELSPFYPKHKASTASENMDMLDNILDMEPELRHKELPDGIIPSNNEELSEYGLRGTGKIENFAPEAEER